MLIELLWRLNEIHNRGRKAAKRGSEPWRNPWVGKGVEFAQAWREGHAEGVAERIAKLPLTIAYAAGLDDARLGLPMSANRYDKTNNEEEYERWNEGWIKGLTRSEAAKIRMYDAQRGICYLCGDMILGTRTATFDHVTPRGRGGDDIDNLLLAHHKCNNDKSSRLPYACELMYLDFINEVIR